MEIASSCWQIEEEQSVARVRLTGSLGLEGARALVALLESLRPTPVILQVAGAVRIEDVAFGVLGLWFALQPDRAVTIRGLDHHGALVLRACGVCACQPPRRPV